MTPSAWRCEQLHVHARLAAVQALEEAAAGELDEVAVALVVGGQQRQVVALDLALVHRAVVDEVGLEPDDRLDPVLLGGLHELDRAVHHAVVGQAEGGLVERRGARGERVDLARAVEQRVLGVDVEVGAAGGTHGRGPRDAASDASSVTRPLRRSPPRNLRGRAQRPPRAARSEREQVADHPGVALDRQLVAGEQCRDPVRADRGGVRMRAGGPRGRAGRRSSPRGEHDVIDQAFDPPAGRGSRPGGPRRRSRAG